MSLGVCFPRFQVRVVTLSSGMSGVVSAKETTLMGCSSDIVRIRARGSDFVTLKE
jgi:hypothetical protein